MGSLSSLLSQEPARLFDVDVGVAVDPQFGDVLVTQIGDERAEKELGLGVVNPRTTAVESSAEIISRVKEVLLYLPPERIFLNPDCGFGTFASRPMNELAIIEEKLAAMVNASRQLREEYSADSYFTTNQSV